MGAEIAVGKKFIAISNKIRRLFDASFVDSGLSGVQASMLHYIYVTSQQRDVFQRDLEAEFDIRPSSASSVLGGLERKGLITRESVAEDARLKRLVVTEKAEDISRHISEVINGIDELLLSGIDGQDAIFLDLVLSRVAENAR